MSGSQKRFILVIILISLCLGGTLFLNGDCGEVSADTREVYRNIEIFTEVLRQIEKSYVEPQDPHDLIYGAIKGMVQNLDPHSSFMTKEEHQELMLETKGKLWVPWIPPVGLAVLQCLIQQLTWPVGWKG